MMKNKMMRLASVLLVAVLLSTCAISGTFAKYVTTASGTDNARVAKWGIQMTNNSSDTFVAKYNSQDSFTVHGQNVSTTTTDVDVVAPGTTSKVTYRASGAPETDYVIGFEYSDVQEVYLGTGKYAYSAPYDAMTKTVTEIYYPIKYQVVLTTSLGSVAYNADANTYPTENKFSDPTDNKTYTYPEVSTLDAALKQLKATTVTFANNDACDVEVTITWTWTITQGTGDEEIAKNNAYDTILGDLAAKPESGDYHLTATGTDGSGNATYNLTVAYTLKMIATQLD